uniref:Uncharacterized protein n=1 Tax=Molossus molossus TaxID=27622 RepID=A0A7J8DQ26_MOLMO|nr:hypothetical protein HJG59_009223 [Molossus molossus]
MLGGIVSQGDSGRTGADAAAMLTSPMSRASWLLRPVVIQHQPVSPPPSASILGPQLCLAAALGSQLTTGELTSVGTSGTRLLLMRIFSAKHSSQLNELRALPYPSETFLLYYFSFSFLFFFYPHPRTFFFSIFCSDRVGGREEERERERERETSM